MGLYTGAGRPKSEIQASLFGGSAGRPYDPCYHQACDTIENINRDVLEQNTRALVRALNAAAIAARAPGTPSQKAVDLPNPTYEKHVRCRCNMVVRRFEADNKCWPSLKKMALQTDLSNLRLHPAPHHAMRSNNPRAQIWEKIRRRAGKCPPRRRNDGAHQGTVKKEDAGRLRHHRYPLGWAQVLALDHSEKSGGPPGSGPPARGRTSSNDHRHDRGKRHSGARSPERSRASEVIRAQTWGSRENPRRTISRAPGALRGNVTASAGRGIARAFGQPAAGDLAAR